MALFTQGGVYLPHRAKYTQDGALVLHYPYNLVALRLTRSLKKNNDLPRSELLRS